MLICYCFASPENQTVTMKVKRSKKSFFFFFLILCVIFLSDLHSKPSAPPLRAHRAAPPPPDDFMNDDMDSYLIAMDTSIAPGPSNTGPPPPSLSGDTRSKRPAAVSHKARILIEEAEEEETDDLDRLPNKKVCLRFLRRVNRLWIHFNESKRQK